VQRGGKLSDSHQQQADGLGLAQKYPESLPVNHAVTSDKRFSGSAIDDALNAIQTEGAAVRVGKFRAFVERQNVQSVFYDDSKNVSQTAGLMRGLESTQFVDDPGWQRYLQSRGVSVPPANAITSGDRTRLIRESLKPLESGNGYTALAMNHVHLTTDSKNDARSSANPQRFTVRPDVVSNTVKNAVLDLERGQEAPGIAISGDRESYDADTKTFRVYLHEMGIRFTLLKTSLNARPMFAV
jgi:hypothetical protein